MHNIIGATNKHQMPNPLMHLLLNRHQTSQAPGAVIVECPRGIDLHKYATAEECAAKIYKTTVRHFGFTEKVYETVTEHT